MLYDILQLFVFSRVHMSCLSRNETFAYEEMCICVYVCVRVGYRVGIWAFISVMALAFVLVSSKVTRIFSIAEFVPLLACRIGSVLFAVDFLWESGRVMPCLVFFRS